MPTRGEPLGKRFQGSQAVPGFIMSAGSDLVLVDAGGGPRTAVDRPERGPVPGKACFVLAFDELDQNAIAHPGAARGTRAVPADRGVRRFVIATPVGITVILNPHPGHHESRLPRGGV